MFKTRLDTFGNDFGLFFFEKFFIILKNFEDSTLHETLGMEKNNHFKTRLQKKILIFLKNRPSWNPKHVQNTFGHFWERFWAFLQF